MKIMRRILRPTNFLFSLPPFLLLFLLVFLTKKGNSQAYTECITIQIINIECNQNETKSTLDDTYSFDVEIEGGDSKWEMDIKGIHYSGFYNIPYSFHSFSINEGPAFLIFNDSLSPNCLGVITIFPPSNCESCLTAREILCKGDTLILSINPSYFSNLDTITSIQWYKNNIPIHEAQDSILFVTEQGSYSAKVSTETLACPIQSCCYFNVYEDTRAQAKDDFFTQCLGVSVENSVATNDLNLNNPTFDIIAFPINGNLQLHENGAFNYILSNSSTCYTDTFTYQVCNNNQINCCDTAMVILDFTDNIPPAMSNVPEDIIISCDEVIPYPASIITHDNCPQIQLEIEETDTQGEDGCSLHDYTLTRTWTASDLCGNMTTDKQVIDIQDITAPDIFKIYTLPNGKKLVAGVMENVNQNWKTISLPINFPTIPLIFTQVVTKEENATIITQIRNVSNAQFELRLQEEEGADGKHLRESVAWIAIEGGNQKHPFPLETKMISLTGAWKQINFEESYISLPSFFGTMQTTVEKDPASLRFKNPSYTSIDIQLEEEASSDIETIHSAEQIALLSIEHGIDFINEKGAIFGETGKVSVNEQWTTVPTQHQYFNPVVIAGIPQNNEAEPGVVSVRNVRANSFEIKFQEWDYLDGQHAYEFVPYLVVEGSLPLNTSILCGANQDSLTIEKDILAIDNCDVNIALQYEEAEVIDGNTRQIIRTWYAEDECGNATGYSQVVPCAGIGLRLKAMLQGAMLQNNDPNLMRDDLRRIGLLPTKEPYSAMPNFNHVGEGGGEECSLEILTTTGVEAIVDWVFIELRDAENKEVVKSTKSALLQRNGNIVSIEGDSILRFDNLIPNDYYVTIRHRNHLKAETLEPYSLDEINIPLIDFRNQFLPVVGHKPFIELEESNALWAGDLNQDEKTIYQGPKNDIFNILLEVLLDSSNINFLPNFINRGYTINDFNLDGVTIYQGPNNDRANLFFNTILKHPDNNLKASNFILSTENNISIVNIKDCQLNNTLAGCDFDNDGKLNHIDSDDDNDGVNDKNDKNAYDENSDSDEDGLSDKQEKDYGTNPLNPCDPYQNHNACNVQDLDEDGKFGNYPLEHSLYDANDRNACIPNPQAGNCSCPDNDGNGYVFICHITESGQKQTLKITLEQWRLRQILGDTCGECL